MTSPNTVSIWEGATTFLMFPALVWLAYLADVWGGPADSEHDDSHEGALPQRPSLTLCPFSATLSPVPRVPTDRSAL